MDNVVFILKQLKEETRYYFDYIKAATRLSNQAWAITDRGKKWKIDKSVYEPLAERFEEMAKNTRAMLTQSGHKLATEKLVRQLPIWTEWAVDIPGVAELSLGQILGETGDLCNYPTKGHVFKRMGVAVMEDGTIQRRVGGDEALLHKFSPRRRAILWNVGGNFVRVSGSKYNGIYYWRKEVEQEKAAKEGLIVAPSAEIPQKDKALYRSEGHINSRAKRYATQVFLKDLWKKWNGLMG